MAETLRVTQKIYDSLWRKAIHALKSGHPSIDPFLTDQKNDRRRGVTLVFRPAPAIQVRANEFLREAAAAASNQHVYQPCEFHVTVLAVIPGSANWRHHLPELPAMRGIIAEVLRDEGAFIVEFRGVTASTEAVMIQGFPADAGLARIRKNLRAAFKRHQIGVDLDRRYKIATAHMTVMRFRQSQTNWKRLQAVLSAHRTTDFGEMRVKNLELRLSDWYASAHSIELFERYQLKKRTPLVGFRQA